MKPVNLPPIEVDATTRPDAEVVSIIRAEIDRARRQADEDDALQEVRLLLALRTIRPLRSPGTAA